MDKTLQVSEIYESVQGESGWAGKPCTFIRLTGCPLRCRWCDTVYGFKGGDNLSISEIVEKALAYKTRLVELTGGEPMAQADCIPLMKELNRHGFEILIETSGSVLLDKVPSYVNIIMDLKCPGSGMEQHNRYENLRFLKKTDELKFVVASYEDFLWAMDTIQKFKLEELCQLLISPAWGLVKPDQLVSWMLETGVKARLNLQLHKYIWSPKAKGV